MDNYDGNKNTLMQDKKNFLKDVFDYMIEEKNKISLSIKYFIS